MFGRRTACLVLATLTLLATAAGADAQVAPQFSLFQTDPSQNVFRFVGRSAIPAGFFTPDSHVFEGAANYRGDPRLEFQGQDVGSADTVGEATVDAAPGPGGSPGQPAPIELKALSLVSVTPIEV